MSFEKIKKITRQLYPTGRVFKMPVGGIFDRLHDALAVSETQAFADGISILDVILPDNDNFTTEDATAWEKRLGMITNPLLSLEERKQAIIRKMNHPGTIPARQNYLYVQEQLQAAGFNLFVYENIFPDGSGGIQTLTPMDIVGASEVGLWEHGIAAEHGEIEHGDFESGSVFGNCVANYIDETNDEFFDVGDNLRNTFYISSEYIENFADIPEIRKDELRQLILKLKPQQTVAFLFVNYTT